MQFYELTDSLRGGDVIMVDGRKHFRFSYGPYQWERTTLFLPYLTEGTSCFGKCRQVSEEEAQALLLKKGKLLAALLKKADKIAEQAHQGQLDKGGVPYIEHPRAVADDLSDMEEKIVALLHDVCEDTPWTVEELKANGFTPQICWAVDLLTHRSGDSYGAYLTRLRQNRIARNVKLMDLSHNMDLTRIPNPSQKDKDRVEKYKRARQYLYGDIASFEEDVDEHASHMAKAGPISCMNIYQALKPQALGGRKVPHGLSNPVLRSRDGKLYLAFFVYTYTRQELQSGAISRPVSWMLADLESGKLVEEIPCSREDFSRASRDGKYSTQNPNGKMPADFHQKTFGILDQLRQNYLQSGTLDQSAYETYMAQMLRAVPPAYHRFYQELSKP
ncbi:MAG: hypothetical protein IJX67_06000 [Oscillospiraceae bacterium]|nr:hypothetical protein [Oscillospiraceae bacterium]